MSELWDGLQQLPEAKSASLGPEHLEVVQETELKKRELLAGLIRRGIEDGEFLPADADLLAHDLIMLAHMWALKGWALHPSLDLDTCIERQLDLVLGQLIPNQPQTK